MSNLSHLTNNFLINFNLHDFQVYFHFLLHIIIASICGLIIGFERQWINRVAGIQTISLVSIGACIFVLGSSFVINEGQAYSRISAQIVSGMGFLGAGVIFRDGFTAHGINTAATIWCSAAVGILCGMGFLDFALFTALTIAFVNVSFRKIDHFITKHRKHIDLRIQNEYNIQVTCTNSVDKNIKQQIINILNINDHKIYSVYTKIDKQHKFIINIQFSTRNLDYNYIQNLCESIEKLENIFIVDWSQVKS